jgi:phospholipase/carboxylesterase
MANLVFRERPAAGEPEGLLVLHHGRGTNELDLLPLADVLDAERRLHIVAPRGPLPFLDGYRWYETPRVGYPEPTSFNSSYRALAELHDGLWQETGLGPKQTVLGGFSMGTVMSYALGLGPDRPAPAGILAFSGFIPGVEGWAPDLEGRRETRVFIAHGVHDPVIEVSFARQARDMLLEAGFRLDYQESPAAHNIDPGAIRRGVAWLAETLAP